MIRNTIVCLLIFLCFTGLSTAETTINIDEYINTNDKTPSIKTLITNGAAEYNCILWIDNVASGSGIILNNTEGSINCNRTLEYGTYIYNISTRAGGGNMVYSSDGTLKISYFGNIIEILESIINIFTPIVTIIIKIIPIFIVIFITTLLCVCIDNVKNHIRGKL